MGSGEQIPTGKSSARSGRGEADGLCCDRAGVGDRAVERRDRASNGRSQRGMVVAVPEREIGAENGVARDGFMDGGVDAVGGQGLLGLW